MSRSNNTEIINPAVKTFEWNGDAGGFRYYDKTAKLKVNVPYPFKFLVLDQLTTIGGFSDADQSGFWSNEIRDTKKELLTVRTKNGIEMIGTYEQVKAGLSAKGADYVKSVYIAYYEADRTFNIGRILIKGAAIGPWIEFCKENKVMEIGVQVNSHTEGKKGKTIYQIPTFEKMDVSETTNNLAIEKDKELQEYLKAYFNRDNANVADEHKAEATTDNSASPIQESRTNTSETTKGTANNSAVTDVDFDDLPF